MKLKWNCSSENYFCRLVMRVTKRPDHVNLSVVCFRLRVLSSTNESRPRQTTPRERKRTSHLFCVPVVALIGRKRVDRDPHFRIIDLFRTRTVSSNNVCTDIWEADLRGMSCSDHLCSPKEVVVAWCSIGRVPQYCRSWAENHPPQCYIYLSDEGTNIHFELRGTVTKRLTIDCSILNFVIPRNAKMVKVYNLDSILEIFCSRTSVPLTYIGVVTGLIALRSRSNEECSNLANLIENTTGKHI